MHSRQAFLAASAGAYATIGLLRFPAGAAEFNYKLSVDLPATHPNVVAMTDAAAKILSESNGQLDIKMFPNNALGGNTKVLPQVREGAIEFAMMVDIITSDVVPTASIDAVGFAFPNYKAAWDAVDGPLGAYIRQQIQQQMGVYPLEIAWDAGFKQMVNSVHPITTPDDLKGLKIRVPPGAIEVSLFKTLGASPVALDTSEMYSAMQTRLVDGADNSAGLILTGKFYEVQKYLSITNHSMAVYHLLASLGPWQRLPKNLQAIAEKNFNAAAKTVRTGAAKDFDSVISQLKAKGIVVIQPDNAPFRNALRAGGLPYWRDKFGSQAWTALEKSVGKLS